MKGIKYFFIGAMLAVCILAYGRDVFASTLIINNIEMNNFLPQTQLYSGEDTYSVNTNGTFSIDYAPDNQKFQIIILSPPYEESRALAEQTFVEKLGITKAESCYLNVSIVAPAYVTDKLDSNKLDLCAQNKQADINSDNSVNTFDYAICLDELALKPPITQKMYCDLNVNHRIDASDLSTVITYIKKAVK